MRYDRDCQLFYGTNPQKNGNAGPSSYKVAGFCAEALHFKRGPEWLDCLNRHLSLLSIGFRGL